MWMGMESPVLMLLSRWTNPDVIGDILLKIQILVTGVHVWPELRIVSAAFSLISNIKMLITSIFKTVANEIVCKLVKM